jgi:hypothetical protein
MNEPDHEEERISLHGHDPEEVLRALLKVDPNSEPVEEKPPAKKPKAAKDKR